MKDLNIKLLEVVSIDFERITGRKLLFIMVLVAGLCCLGFFACGGGESQPGKASADSPSQKADQPSAKDNSSSDDPSSKKPEGWQTVKLESWSVSFPGNWTGDEETGIWEPGEAGPFMGRPDLSFLIGGMPVMAPESFEDRVKVRINGEPQERENVSVSGFSGFKCSWEQMGKKHRGLFLEEKISGGMIVIHFFDCQAPEADFDQYKADFEKILDSAVK
jgi:hypothetical protein